jgi:hypothetical protein
VTAGGAKHLTVYAGQQSQEIDGVVDLLRAGGWSLTRHNISEYPERYFVSYSAESKVSRGAHWLHSVPPFSTASSLTGLEREVSLRECIAFWEGVWKDVPTSRWLNTPASISAASNKLFQLKLATRLGINVPQWLVSNSSDAIAEFAAAHGDVVLKSLSSGFIPYGAESFKFYTRRATPALLDRLSGANLSPVIVQNRVHKRYEVRATIVANEVYCSALDYEKIPDVTDYRELDLRAHREAFAKCPVSLADQVADASRKIAAEYGLRFAGLDWVVDLAGTPHFLEINPLPSFKWYELCGAGDISGALARALMEINRENE